MLISTNETTEEKLVRIWLKTHKPSVIVDDKEPMEHISYGKKESK